MQTINFSISDSAAKQISYLISQEKAKESKFRIAVNGGGCSGFKYDFSITTELSDDDLILQKDDAVVVIDKISMEYIRGGTLDYICNLSGAYFEVKNPTASSRCGCGNSFSI